MPLTLFHSTHVPRVFATCLLLLLVLIPEVRATDGTPTPVGVRSDTIEFRHQRRSAPEDAALAECRGAECWSSGTSGRSCRLGNQKCVEAWKSPCDCSGVTRERTAGVRSQIAPASEATSKDLF